VFLKKYRNRAKFLSFGSENGSDADAISSCGRSAGSRRRRLIPKWQKLHHWSCDLLSHALHLSHTDTRTLRAPTAESLS